MGRKLVVVSLHRFFVDFHAFHVESLDPNVVETKSKRNARAKTAGEQVDVAIFGDHVLRIEPQWLWEVDPNLFFTLSHSLPLFLPVFDSIFALLPEVLKKQRRKEQSYLYFLFCDQYPPRARFRLFLYLFSCTRDLFVLLVFFFFFSCFEFFFF